MKKLSEEEAVQVTKCCLPPLDDYLEYVKDIFSSHILTNNAKYEIRLETELKNLLNVPCLALCANGTLALQLALRLLKVNGKKIVTTPFTYVATLSSILWEGGEAVFADIEPDSLCIDPERVEECLRKDSEIAAILPVHVYGNACDVNALGYLANKYNVKLIYDGAHAFGCRLNGDSIFRFGDASTASFHATKLFHTVEGGAIATPDIADMHALKLLRAFGHIGDNYECVGINAKMSELHAAMGLALLPHISEIIEKRAKLVKCYDELLHLDEGSLLRRPRLRDGLEWNFSYYPVIFANSEMLEKVVSALVSQKMYPRRYFYPSLTKLPYVNSPPCPVAEDISSRVLCLPLWAEMDTSVVEKVASIVLNAMKI